MKYALLVLSSPNGGQYGDTPWRFADAAIAAGHTVHQVFFYHEAVYQGNELTMPAQDEINRVERWASFAQSHNTELILCVSSALKRGVVDTTEADRYELSGANAHPAFSIAGLGQLVDASSSCDRLLTFGC
jgi:tRNA 2-thiouridine synthesizing protein D